MGGDLVGDDAVFDILLVWQAQMFLWCDVAEHRAAVPAVHRGANGAGDVVVAGSDVSGQRAKSVKGSFVAPLQLFGHVFLDHVDWDMPGAFVHYLSAVRPGALRQVSLRLQLGELRLVIGIRDGAWPQTVADGKAHIVSGHNLADFIPMRVA